MLKPLTIILSFWGHKMIYLIGQKKDWHRNPFKIGFSVDPSSRILSLQTGNPYPIKVVKTWEGGIAIEREIQSVLSNFRAMGGSEWFDPLMMPPSLNIKWIVERSWSAKSLVKNLNDCFETSSADIDVVARKPALIQASINFDQPPSPFSMTPADREWILYTYAHNGLIPKR